VTNTVGRASAPVVNDLADKGVETVMGALLPAPEPLLPPVRRQKDKAG
jgi:hypothetical protein